MCGPLIPLLKRRSVFGAEKYFSNMVSPCVIGGDGPNHSSRRVRFYGELTRTKPFQGPSNSAAGRLHSPLGITPHNARNGNLPITCRNRHCPKVPNQCPQRVAGRPIEGTSQRGLDPLVALRDE